MEGSAKTSVDTENLMTTLCNVIWTTEDICNEQKFVKRPWYFRDTRMMSNEASDWEIPVLWIQIKKTEKITLSFGPVIAVAACDFKKGHGKEKSVARGLNFLTMCGKKGFLALVVDMDLYDMSSLHIFPQDPVVKEVANTIELDIFKPEWVASVIDDANAMMLPLVQQEYKRIVGKQFQPTRRLKVRKPTASGSGASSMAKDTNAGSVSGKETSQVEARIPNTQSAEGSQGATPSGGRGRRPGKVIGQGVKEVVAAVLGVQSLAAALPKKQRTGGNGVPTPSSSVSLQEVEVLVPMTSSPTTTAPTIPLEDEEEETPLASFETDAIKAELAKLMLERRVQRTSVLLHVNNLLFEDEGEKSTLVRPVDRLHVENIKMLLMKNPSNFTAPFVVVVDPNDCPNVKDWDITKSRTWMYRVIGGNHGARAKAELFKMYGKQVYGEIEAWVYSGLTRHEIRMLAFQHNYDQEYRKNMSSIDIVRACHNIFVEMNVGSTKQVREACCKECMLDYTPGVRDTMAKHDPTFQIAFRSGEIWDLQDQIFSMWQKFEILGQTKPVLPKQPAATTNGKSKVKPKPLSASQMKMNKLSGHFNLRVFRALQGLSNQEHIKRLLNRVIGKKITLDQMFKEGEMLKKLAKVKKLFLQISGQQDWATCREMFPEETDVKVLSTWCEKLTDAFKVTSKRKKKVLSGNEFDEGVEVEIPSCDIPYVFKNYVLEAIEKHNRRQNISSIAAQSSEHQWKNANGDAFSYSLHVGDIRQLATFLKPKHFTLAIADIPYGFNAPGSQFDEEPFSEQDVFEMVTDFAKVTTSPMWRFVVIHSLQQTNSVMNALEKVCNCGVEAGIWEKTNIHQHPSGARLAWAFENWSIGYYSEDGIRKKDMYNFAVDESRVNIVKVPCVTTKSVSPLGVIVNPYQKPIALGDWFVNHFSEPGDWIADLCCGTGSTLVAALLNSRNGCAVDKGESQVDFLKGRIMTLESVWSLYDEAQESGTGGQGEEVQPPVGGQLGVIGTTVYVDGDGDDKEGPEENEPNTQEVPRTPDENELNDMLLD